MIDENTSDGYHTFKELYDHRIALFLVLMGLNRHRSWKSKHHDDGTSLDGWFIAGIDLPGGNITYHLPMKDWDYAQVRELPAAPEWDGHTPADVVDRLYAWVEWL